MGSYTFKWDVQPPPEEVYVTGSFDDWRKSVKLDKTGETAFSKTVPIPHSDDKISYKYVVDGSWIHDSSARTETDDKGNLNNLLLPEDLTPTSTQDHLLSSVAPGASTTTMASEQPQQKETSPPPPGAFPETPAPNDEQTFSVDPKPASGGTGNPIQTTPGEKLSENVKPDNSMVHTDEELKSKDEAQTMSVNPIPASGGVGNPIHLEPGEKVPDQSEITPHTIESTRKSDQASYEKSDAGAPTLPTPLSPQGMDEAKGAPIFAGLGPQTTNVIPESSLPMGNNTDSSMADAGPTISSVAPQSSTNQLAGQVPKEPRGVPEVVGDSQKAAHVDPEASANPEAVQEKKETENELKKEVSEQPSSSEPGKSEGGVTGAIAGGVAAAGAAVGGAALAANQYSKDKTGTDPAASLPQAAQDKLNGPDAQSSVPRSVTNQDTIPQQTEAGKGVEVPKEEDPSRATASQVPEEVTTSQKEAHESPEAAANPEAVQEKSQVEKELMSEVKQTSAQAEPAPTASAVAATTAPNDATTSSGAPQLSDPVAGGLAPLSMEDKGGLNASAQDPAQPPTSADKVNQLAAEAKQQDSRDVSPGTSMPTREPQQQDQPQVTTGVGASAAPAEQKGTQEASSSAPAAAPATPQKNASESKSTPESAQTSDSAKKDKRRSFFGRIKDKLKQ